METFKVSFMYFNFEGAYLTQAIAVQIAALSSSPHFLTPSSGPAPPPSLHFHSPFHMHVWLAPLTQRLHSTGEKATSELLQLRVGLLTSLHLTLWVQSFSHLLQFTKYIIWWTMKKWKDVIVIYKICIWADKTTRATRNWTADVIEKKCPWY